MKKNRAAKSAGVCAWLAVFCFGCAQEEVVIQLWTDEGVQRGAYEFVSSLAEAYSVQNSEVIIEVVGKNSEALRTDFHNASAADRAPALLWTVNYHAGPFVADKIIQPVDRLVDLTQYVESVRLDGQTWGVPISNGNHLMLLYNRELISSPPQESDELLRVGSELSGEGSYAIVWNQSEPSWLIPWLGGFNGRVFGRDGFTPTLNTPEMVDTLNFLYDLTISDITPSQIDYAEADTLFKEGRAAMIINGDWSLVDYHDTLGDKLGITRLPRVSATGRYPAPYTSGKYFMIPADVSGATLRVVVDIIAYMTNYDNQVALAQTLFRLPALLEALQDPVVTHDPLLSGSAQQLLTGTPVPPIDEMQCNWDAMKPEMSAVLAGERSAQEAAAAMQVSAENCIADLADL